VSSSEYDDKRPILLAAARGLIEAAELERRLLPERSAERQFYLGVDAAAREVLHPELGSSRADDWLDREKPAFRDGYLRTSILIATTATSDDPPHHLALPSPSRGR
jgi:hypothetical protein